MLPALHDLTPVLGWILGWLFLCFAVGQLAARHHRSPATWVLLAVLLSPLGALIFLCIVGDPQQAAALAQEEERIRQQHPGRQDAHEAVLNAMACPHCGAAVNPVTMDGLHAPEAEPWLLICDGCAGEVEPDG